MITKSKAIKNFLAEHARPELSKLYTFDMEVQVNVSILDGERTEREYLGKKYIAWTNGVDTWKPFRIPHKANSDPEYTDTRMNFDLAKYAEGIGMTGWDWTNRVSKWVAFDFDAITGHADSHQKKLTDEQLKEISDIVWSIPWVTIRRSTSGNGLHLYVFINDIPTQNHNEHAALGRAILGKLCTITGFDFNTKVDNCGGNIWVWHKKFEHAGGQSGSGLKLIKDSVPLDDIPTNWRDHLVVISGKRSKNKPSFIPDTDVDSFEEFCGQHNKIHLEDEHKRLLTYLDKIKALWWFDTDNHLMVAHTYDLQKAHTELGLKGIFKTLATGKEQGQDQNCYAFPLRGGAWVVRRHTLGVQEHETWQQDSGGWTKCYLNKEPDLTTAARSFGGIEDDMGGFVFNNSEAARKAAQILGTEIDIPDNREVKLKTHKDGRLLVEFNKQSNESIDGWLDKKSKWKKLFDTKIPTNYEPETGNYDDIIRHIVTETGNVGWVIKRDGDWCIEPIKHIELALTAFGVPVKDIKPVMGSIVMKAWTLVNRPFQPEYPGNREWNRGAVQLAYTPSIDTDNLRYSTWDLILDHCGYSLNDAIKEHPWFQKTSIKTGCDYLKHWLAFMFQKPFEPLPYLFFYGPQNSGKTTFYEATALLLTKGVVKAQTALTTNFNAELENAILCVIEETDLRDQKGMVYNKIKDLVTSKTISIHGKGKTPYEIPNSSHWAQFSNHLEYCPIFPGDTRITMSFVDLPKKIIGRNELHARLKKEASDFISLLLSIELPNFNDRLGLPALETQQKKRAEELNKSDLQTFLDEHFHYAPGYVIKFSEFFDRFKEWLDPSQINRWSKIAVGRELPDKFPKGRLMSQGAQFYIGNIHSEPPTDKKKKIILTDGKLTDGDFD